MINDIVYTYPYNIYCFFSFQNIYYHDDDDDDDGDGVAGVHVGQGKALSSVLSFYLYVSSEHQSLVTRFVWQSLHWDILLARF